MATNFQTQVEILAALAARYAATKTEPSKADADALAKLTASLTATAPKETIATGLPFRVGDCVIDAKGTSLIVTSLEIRRDSRPSRMHVTTKEHHSVYYNYDGKTWTNFHTKAANTFTLEAKSTLKPLLPFNVGTNVNVEGHIETVVATLVLYPGTSQESYHIYTDRRSEAGLVRTSYSRTQTQPLWHLNMTTAVNITVLF